MIVRMSNLEAYKRFWTEAFNLHDRARRKEFWVPFLIHTCLYTIVSLIVLLYYKVNDNHIYMTANFVFFAVTCIPTFSVFFRRLQDLNISGWWYLIMPFIKFIDELPSYFIYENLQLTIGFMGIIGKVVLLVVMTFDGTEGPNRFGHDPKEVIDELNPRQY
ncbi:inner membrane protein YhaI [Macrococcus hajekii]|nr:DUF805 domain-containing protein [Macrococcus hajekii]GGB01263.1 inner membrane protein YhaI [Macrococcus hajekii]